MTGRPAGWHVWAEGAGMFLVDLANMPALEAGMAPNSDDAMIPDVSAR